jgi:hypothetical protein
MKMRKVFIIALGLAALGMVSAGTASARVWHCTSEFLYPHVSCRWIPDPPPKPTTPWKGNSSSATKTYSGPNATHQK